MAYSDPSLIDKYLLGRMQPPEQEKFAQMMEADAQLAQQVRERKEAIRTVEMLGDYVLKERVKKIHDSHLRLTQKRKKRKYAILAIFVLVIMGLFYFCYYTPSQQFKPNEIFAAYFSPYALNYGDRDQVVEPVLTRFNVLYKQEKYAEALQVLAQYSDSSLASNLLIAKANAQLAIGENQAASSIFQSTLQDPIYGEYSRWYLALSLFRQERLEECIQLLEDIRDRPNHYKHAEAISLLKKIK